VLAKGNSKQHLLHLFIYGPLRLPCGPLWSVAVRCGN